MMHTRSLVEGDAGPFADAFAAIGWKKPVATFHRYLAEEAAGTRWTGVAEWDGELAGYLTVLWLSLDPMFARERIPEVVDLNVLPAFRRRGIGMWLLEVAEAVVVERSLRIGLQVGLHSGYGPAQRLYAKRGYIPDGAGTVRKGVVIPEKGTVQLDDDVTLRLIKRLR